VYLRRWLNIDSPDKTRVSVAVNHPDREWLCWLEWRDIMCEDNFVSREMLASLPVDG
jgi:hypothetical protein